MKETSKTFTKWMDRQLEKLMKKEQAELDVWLEFRYGSKEFERHGTNWTFIFGQIVALEAVQKRLGDLE